MNSPFREAHALYDIHTILGTNKRWMVCPLPGHRHVSNTPSFSIFVSPDGVQRFKCHGNCAKQGDVIDLVGYMNMNDYDYNNEEHIKMALGFLSQRFEIKPPVIEKPKRIPGDEYKHYLPPSDEVIKYAATRGLTVETLEHFDVGSYESYMSMPCFEDRYLVGIKFRNIREGGRFWQARGSRKGLFNYDEVAYTSEPVLIVKGEIPAMLCSQWGFLTCAPTAGENSDVGTYMDVLSWSDKRVVVGDNDAPGFARKRRQQLHAYLKFPPEQYKDIDEYMLAEPENARKELTKWLSY